MKVLLTICFLFWCLMTLLLVVSILGLVVLAREDASAMNYQGEEGESSWMKIGKTILTNLVK